MKKWKPFKRDDSSINFLLDMVYGYQKSRTLFTAIDLDLFSIIGTDSKTAEEISVLIDSEKFATKRLLDALCSLNLLEKFNEKYSNSTISLRFLVKNKPEYISIMKHGSYAWESWSNLTEAIKKGEPKKKKKIPELKGDELEAFVDSVHWRSALLAKDIVNEIDLSNVHKIMDLGGGVGDYAIAFVNQKPDIESFIFTYENCAPYAKDFLKYVENREVANQISVEVGDLLNDDLSKGYDLIFLSFVFQNFTIWDNIKLAKKVFDSLNSGGKIVIQDLLISDDRTNPEFNALYSLELLAQTGDGDTYTSADIWLILKEAWFTKIHSYTTDFGTSLVFGEKF